MLDFSMSEEQQIMKDTVARLVKDMVIGNASEMDESADIPNNYLQAAWELGVLRSAISEDYGGYGMDYSPVMNAIVLEEMAYGDMGFAIAAMLPSLFLYPIYEMGTTAQKNNYLPLYCTESYPYCSVAVNEPHFGFDPYDQKTRAEKKNGSYILNGRKCFVFFAKEASAIMASACLDGVNSFFIISTDNLGLKIGEKERNLGLYSLSSYEIELKDCEVPAEDRIGGESGCDFDAIIQKMRIAAAALGTGVARASFEYARDYAKERIQFGEPIAHKQAIAFMVAEMAYEVEAMRLMTWKAASKIENGLDACRDAYLARLYTGEMAVKVTDYGIQVLGGHGFIREHPVERYYRNARGISIIEGMATV